MEDEEEIDLWNEDDFYDVEDDEDHSEEISDVPENMTKLTAIELARKTLEDGVLGTGFVSEESVSKSDYTNCHSRISYRPSKVEVVFSRIGTMGLGSKGDVDRPAARAYLEWITGPESPWRSITKEFNPDLDFVVHKGVLIGDLDTAPANMVYSFFIATRFVNEFHNLCNFWWSLVEQGVNRAYALALCTKHQTQWTTYGSWVGGHGGLTSAVNPVRLDRAEPNKARLNDMYSDNGQCAPADALWADGARGQTYQDKVFEVPKDIYGLFEHPNGIQKVSFNPNFEALVAACKREQEQLGLQGR